MRPKGDFTIYKDGMKQKEDGTFEELPEGVTMMWGSTEGWISVKERLPENTNDVLCIHGKHQFVGKYTKGHELEFEDEDYEGEYDEFEDKNGTLYLKAGWYECEEQAQSAYDIYWMKREPSHWQPLPSPPNILKEGE